MRLFAGAAVLAILVATAQGARAEPVDDVTRAREQFQAGLQLEDAGKWPAALEAFRTVASVRSTPQVRYHVGVCLEHTGHLVAALAELAAAEKDAKDSADADQQLVSARAGQHATQVRARTPRVTIANATPAEKIQVSVDGEPRALDQGAFVVDPGPHRIVVLRDAVTVIDTRVTGREQVPAQVIALDATQKREAGSSSVGVAPWIAGGVAVLALAGAGVTALLRASAVSDLDDGCGVDRRRCPESLRSTLDRASTLTTLTNVLLIGAGVAAIATGALWLASRGRSPAPTAREVGLAF